MELARTEIDYEAEFAKYFQKTLDEYLDLPGKVTKVDKRTPRDHYKRIKLEKKLAIWFQSFSLSFFLLGIFDLILAAVGTYPIIKG